MRDLELGLEAFDETVDERVEAVLVLGEAAYEAVVDKPIDEGVAVLR